MQESIIILTLAFALDQVLGDPVYRLHPVRLIGNAASRLEDLLMRMGLNSRGGGFLYAVLLLCGVNFLAVGIVLAAGIVPGLDLVVMVFLLYSCIGLKDLVNHARPIAFALEQGSWDKAGDLLQGIVGRDATLLSEKGIIRAAVESIAENFVDAFLGLVFWFMVGVILGYLSELPPALVGVAFALSYRTINTLDAMVGYKSKKYLNFGRTSARVDDLLNHVPARVSIFIICFAALLRGHDWKRCLLTGLRDRQKHVSPNAGHPESAVAGALGISLGGPVDYAYGLVEKKWMGDELKAPCPGDILKSIHLITCAAWISLLSALLILLFWS